MNKTEHAAHSYAAGKGSSMNAKQFWNVVEILSNAKLCWTMLSYGKLSYACDASVEQC